MPADVALYPDFLAKISPHDVRLLTAFEPEASDAWDWGKWLPHQRVDPNVPGRFLFALRERKDLPGLEGEVPAPVAEPFGRAELRAQRGFAGSYVIAYFPRIAYDHTPMQRYAREVLSKFV